MSETVLKWVFFFASFKNLKLIDKLQVWGFNRLFSGPNFVFGTILGKFSQCNLKVFRRWPNDQHFYSAPSFFMALTKFMVYLKSTICHLVNIFWSILIISFVNKENIFFLPYYLRYVFRTLSDIYDGVFFLQKLQ